MGSWTAGRFGSLAGRWRSQDTAVRDGALAVILAAAAFVPGLSSVGAQFGDLPLRPADVLAALLVLGQTLPLAVRTRWPAPSLAAVGTCFAVHESLGYPPTFGSLGLYLALYSAGAWQDRLRRLLATAATAGYVIFSVVLHLLGSPQRLADYAIFYLALAAFWVIGAFVRRHRAEEAERRESKAREAASAERSRIARELHDVVTHHVTAMVVQADAGQFLTAWPDRVAQNMTAISGTGRRALAELRYLLAVLEATGEPLPAGRSPALGTLRDLVEQTRIGGQPVEFIEEGASLPLAVGAELAVYRVVQEALTNAIKHAAGRRTVVRVDHEPGLVDIEVTTTGAILAGTGETEPASPAAPGGLQPAAGRGLAGLHERVGMLGGEFMAAPQPGGGFRVHARIPSRSGS
jgi:signal transduction histidine kinase